MLEKAVQPKPSTPHSSQVHQVNPLDKKRKRDQKGKEVVEEGRGFSSKKFEPQKGAKTAKTIHTRSSSEGPVVERGRGRQSKVPTWNPP